MSCPVLLIRTSRPQGVVSSKGPLGRWLCQPVSSPGFRLTPPSSHPPPEGWVKQEWPEDKMSRFLICVLRSQKLPCYLGLTEAPCSPLAAILVSERNKVLLGFHKITFWPESEVQMVPAPGPSSLLPSCVWARLPDPCWKPPCLLSVSMCYLLRWDFPDCSPLPQAEWPHPAWTTLPPRHHPWTSGKCLLIFIWVLSSWKSGLGVSS